MSSRLASRASASRNRRSSRTKRDAETMTAIAAYMRALRAILCTTSLALALLVPQLAMLIVARDAAAQTYPTRPVRLMVGAPAGGGTDIVARVLGAKITDTLTQPPLRVTRAGAPNTIAADVTGKAP